MAAGGKKTKERGRGCPLDEGKQRVLKEGGGRQEVEGEGERLGLMSSVERIGIAEG